VSADADETSVRTGDRTAYANNMVDRRFISAVSASLRFAEPSRFRVTKLNDSDSKATNHGNQLLDPHRDRAARKSSGRAMYLPKHERQSCSVPTGVHPCVADRVQGPVQ
jgi:hypothetical protein